MGAATEPVDSKGRKKVKCGECGAFFHRVDLHVAREHGLPVENYKKRHPQLPLVSPAAKEMLRRKKDQSEEEIDEADESAPLRFGVARLNARKNSPEDQAFVPAHDEDWIPGPSEIRNLEYLALAMEDDENVLLVGPPGVGKTTLARELAALVDAPLRRLPFHGEMRVSDLVGTKDLVIDPTTGQTITAYTRGPLPDSATRGHWALFDEFDAAPPQVAFVLHSAMERPRQLTIMADGSGREVKFHEHFRVIATANTLGYGDDTGLYAGTGPLNEALLDRFGVVIRIGYPTPDEELNIITKRTGIERAIAERMVSVATQVREAQSAQATMVSLSPRRVVAWASKTKRLEDSLRAAEVAILNKLPPDDATYVRGIIQRHFGGSP